MTRILTLEGIVSGYGEAPVLHDVSLEVDEGEIVAVLGANGAGKSTLLRTISGLLRPWAGTVHFGGREIGHLPAHRIVSEGIAMIPEGGRLFPFLSVEENLELGAYSPAARRCMKETMGEVLALFPILAERRRQLAGSLSGGERQMCAIARGVMSKPKLLMLDEPSLGLAPVMVDRVFALIQTLAAQEGLTILLVEQNVAEALNLCQRGYIMERGEIVKMGVGGDLLTDEDVKRAYMGI